MEFLLQFTSILIALLLLCLLIGKLKLPTRNLPPGPTPLPIIGNLLELGDKPHNSLAQLAKLHGPILSLQLGQVTTIVISSASLAKEILKTQDLNFCNRKIPEAIKAQNHHEAGMGWVPVSSRWRNIRKICNSNIFTAQKLDSKQDLRRIKVRELLEDADKRSRTGEGMDIGEAAFKTTINLLSNTMFSIDLADDTKGLNRIVRSLMEEVGKPNLADYFPVLRMIDPQGIKRRTAALFGKFLDLFDGIISQRLEMRHTNVRCNDVLDTLLDFSQDGSDMISSNDIRHLLLDLFIAGTDTTSATLEWAMAEVLRKPEVFAKARSELEDTIGKGNSLEESDIHCLPYLQAIVKETFRLHPSIPLLLPHEAGADTEISGFTIPKGAQVLINAWTIGRDPSLWENPSCFVPERFLESDVDFKGNHFGLIPFGGGRRICPGLPLATRMLHLMLGSLIYSFDWKLESGESLEKLDMEEKFGLTLEKAQPLRVIPVHFRS